MNVKEYRKLSNPLIDCPVIVGVDPGMNTGVACYSRVFQTWTFHTLTFWEAIDLVSTFPVHYGIVIEVPGAHKRVLYVGKDNDGAGRGRERMAANVGSNRREAELLATRFEALGYLVVRVKPVTAKWSAADLKRHLGITDRTNEHVRDAIKIASVYI